MRAAAKRRRRRLERPGCATDRLVTAVRDAGGALNADVRDAHPLPGVGLFAQRDLHPGDVLAVVPAACILGVEAALRSAVGRAAVNHVRVVPDAELEAASGVVPQRAVLQLYLVACRHITCDALPAAHVAYAQSLPADTGLPVTWPERQRRQLLGGTDLERRVALVLAELRRQFDVLFPKLTAAHPTLFAADVFSWEAWLWAHTIVSSRAFPASCLDGASSDAADAAACGVLIPVLDIANHNPGGADMAWDPATCCAVMRKAVKAGSQIWSCYGAKPTACWLHDYGFAPWHNAEHDSVTIRIGATFSDSPKTRSQKLKLFCRLANNRASLECMLTHATPLPDLVMDAARVCCLTPAEAAAYDAARAASARTRAAASTMVTQLLQRRIAAILDGVGGDACHVQQLTAAQRACSSSGDAPSVALTPPHASAAYRDSCLRLLRLACTRAAACSV